jgi:hypothetical protein
MKLPLKIPLLGVETPWKLCSSVYYKYPLYNDTFTVPMCAEDGTPADDRNFEFHITDIEKRVAFNLSDSCYRKVNQHGNANTNPTSRRGQRRVHNKCSQDAPDASRPNKVFIRGPISITLLSMLGKREMPARRKREHLNGTTRDTRIISN